MSIKIIVPGFTYTGSKVLTDPVESSGSLMLIEPNHPVTQWDAGVPLNGALLPNVLANNAALLGIDGLATFANSGITSSVTTKGLIERTTKGGLHTIASQTTLVNGNGVTITFPTDLVQYLIDNAGNDIYMSAWLNNTRTGADAQPAKVLIGTSSSTEFLTYWYKTNIAPTSAPERLGNLNANQGGTLGAVHQAIGIDSWSSGTPASASIEANIKWGRVGDLNGTVSGYADSLPSFVLYRFYMEDLTVSGRTFATVRDLDAAAYSAAFGVGGRYNADSFTDPTTIP